MENQNTTRIKNFLKKEYLDALVKNKDLSKTTRTNILITKFFNKQFIHMHTDDNTKKRKFFFSYRNKYLNEFKKEKDNLRKKMYSFKHRKTIEKFKDKFTASEWEKISGDELIKYLSIDGRIKSNKDCVHFMDDIIKIMLSKLQRYL